MQTALIQSPQRSILTDSATFILLPSNSKETFTFQCFCSQEKRYNFPNKISFQCHSDTCSSLLCVPNKLVTSLLFETALCNQLRVHVAEEFWRLGILYFYLLLCFKHLLFPMKLTSDQVSMHVVYMHTYMHQCNACCVHAYMHQCNACCVHAYMHQCNACCVHAYMHQCNACCVHAIHAPVAMYVHFKQCLCHMHVCLGDNFLAVAHRPDEGPKYNIS